MVSKDQIHRELEKILRYLQNLIQSDNELTWKSKEISIFRETTKKIHRLKNHMIWICIYKEIKETSEEIEINHEKRK